MKILTYIADLSISNKAGGCKYCLTTSKQYSKYEITLCGIEDISKYNLDNFDIIHIHTLHNKFLKPTKAKLIFGMHGLGFSCPPGGLYCMVLNKFLKEPLTCLNCLGYLGIKTGGENLSKCLALAKKSDLIAVDSMFMKEFYHAYNPILMPLPMETDILIPCDIINKKDYLLYTGRLSFEKNPFGFLEIIKRTSMQGKMVVYDTVDDIMDIKIQYNDILNCKDSNIEIILNPSKEHMIELIKHAKFTVLPYFFAEPFGVAAANSVLCGTPLVAFPYGNVRNMTHLLPKTLDEMIQLLLMNNEQYKIELNKTLLKSKELRLTHKPENAIKVWDDIYKNLYETKR